MNIQSIIIFLILVLTFVFILFKIFYGKRNRCWYCSGDCSHCSDGDEHSKS